MNLSRAAAFPVLALLCQSCGGERVDATPARPPLTGGVSGSSGYASPAHWRYHPAKSAKMVARVVLPGGESLFAGRSGERWLVDTEGIAHPAARLAPETLIAIQQEPEDGWVFVGASGTRYEAPQPLAAFSSASTPVDDLVRLAVSGPVLVGIQRDGRLVRRDGRGPWADVGPRAPRMVAVGFRSPSAGLALAYPEALWETRDTGRTWTRMDVPPRGAIDLAEDDQEGVVVETILGPLRWSPDDGSKLAPLGRSPEHDPQQVKAAVPLGPSAEAIARGRAVVVGGRYRELRRGKKPLTHDIVAGPVGGALKRKPAKDFDGCREVRLSRHDRVEVVACGRLADAGVSQPLELHRSEDGGRRFEADVGGLEGAIDDLRIVIGRDGVTIVSGACWTPSSGRGCRPSGILVRRRTRDAGDGYEFEHLPVRGLAGSPLAVAFDADGERVIALGRSAKSGRLALFVSDEALESFRVTELSTQSAAEDGDASVSASGRSDDGSLAFVVAAGEERRIVVVDAGGRLLAESSPPGDRAAVGAAGARALALLPPHGDAWESLDAGATWRPMGRPPIDPCGSRRACDVPVACFAGGCVVDEQLSRIGWDGQADGTAAPDLEPYSRSTPPPLSPKVETPYVCTLGPDEWAALPAGARPPTADRAGFAGVDWFSLVEDARTASVRVVRARAGSRPTMDDVWLLDPVRTPERHAVAATLQVEGAAALRYPVPEASAAPRSRTVGVEVAWLDLLSGTRGRARIRDGGEYVNGDVDRQSHGAHAAEPDLLSIGSGGIYVRLHKALKDNQPTYFSAGGRVEAIPPPDWPAQLTRYGRGEMAHVGSAHVALRLSDVAVARMARSGGAWTLQAEAVGLRRPGDFGVHQRFDIAYVGRHAGLHVILDDPERRSVTSFIRPFAAGATALDPPVVVPTQHSLGPDPKRCSDSVRHGTPRIVAPYHPGTRHPVLVTDSLEPLRVLLTDRAVMHGTPDTPCVVSFDAELVSVDPDDRSLRMRAILPLDHLDHAWLVRFTERRRRSDAVGPVEYRTMSCRLDPTGPVPGEVYRANGTAVP